MKKQVEYLQRLFYDIWNDFGSVYLIVKYSSKTIIGKRGFTEEEMKQGLILVFNNKTNNTLDSFSTVVEAFYKLASIESIS